MDLKLLIFTILFDLSVGLFLSLGFLKQSQVDRRYFIYHGLGIALVTLLAYLFLGRAYLVGDEVLVFWGFLCGVTLFSLTAGSHRLVSWASYLLTCLIGLFLIVVNVERTSLTAALSHQALAPLVTNALLSTGLLGFAMAAMLLGHWYLVQPRMSIEELKRITAVLVVLITARFVFGTYHLFTVLSGKSEFEIYRYLLSTSPGIFLLMRWAWGLLGPLLLSYLIWNTVSIRSTQSATGILYVAVLCVLTGETLSQYLAFFHAIPL